jgi:hypothetical protein
VLWALTLPVLAVAAVSMIGPRASQIVYGRYWDALLGPVAALGLLLLAQGTRSLVGRAALVVVPSMMATGVLVAVLRQDDIDAAILEYGDVSGGGNRILGLMIFLPSEQQLPVLRITVIAALLAAVPIGLTMAGPRSARLLRGSALGLLASLSLFAIDRGSMRIGRSDDGAMTAAEVTEIVDEGLVPAGAPLRFQLSGVIDESPTFLDAPGRREHFLHQRWMLYQFFLPDWEIRPYDPDAPVTAEPYVFALRDDPQFADGSRRIVWEDPRTPHVLWSPPGR